MKPLELSSVLIPWLGGSFLSDELPLALWFGPLLAPSARALWCCCNPAEAAAPVPACADQN